MSWPCSCLKVVTTLPRTELKVLRDNTVRRGLCSSALWMKTLNSSLSLKIASNNFKFPDKIHIMKEQNHMWLCDKHTNPNIKQKVRNCLCTGVTLH